MWGCGVWECGGVGVCVCMCVIKNYSQFLIVCNYQVPLSITNSVIQYTAVILKYSPLATASMLKGKSKQILLLHWDR